MGLEELVSNIKKGLRTTAAILSACAMLYCSNPTPDPEPDEPNIEEPDEPEDPDNPIQLSENVQLLSNNIVNKIISFDESYVTFSEPLNEINSLFYGDIIICDRTSSTPQGLLRKITGFSNDKLTIYTTPVALEEIISNYSFNFNRNLNPSQRISSNLEKGVTERNIHSKGSFDYNLNNFVLYDADGNLSTTDDQIVANGTISFNSNLELDVEIGNNLKKLTFVNSTMDNIDITATCSRDFSNINESTKIAEHDFSPIVFYTPTTPPIPIIINPKIEFYVGINGNISPISATLKQNANLSVGASYDGSWAPIYNFINNFQFDTSQFPKDIELSLYASGKLSAHLYDILGTYAEVKGSIEFNSWLQGINRYWELFGKLKGDVGVDMKIFGKYLTDYNKTLIDNSELLANGSESLPLNILTIQPGPEGKDMYITTQFLISGGTEYSSHDETYLDVEYFGSSGWRKDSLIQFPLSSIPSGSDIVSAKLELYGQGGLYDESPLVKIYKITSPWTESEWGPGSTNYSPSYGEFITSSTLTDEVKWHEWDVTSLVEDWMNGESNYGLMIRTNYKRPWEEGGFKSSDYTTDPTKRPKLIITYY